MTDKADAGGFHKIFIHEQSWRPSSAEGRSGRRQRAASLGRLRKKQILSHLQGPLRASLEIKAPAHPPAAPLPLAGEGRVDETLRRPLRTPLVGARRKAVTSYLQGWLEMNASELIFIGIDVDKETLEVAVDDKSMTIVKSGIPWNPEHRKCA
ncbi:MAG: hypothetical protein V5B40_00250 [Candidatus Accumulibacter meliphilus]|uniref:hypothetical protein n=1 Tax=Candidatus Accumulibacter meliphilus TaxID=2211374 RepID=UPI002FC291D2